MDDSDIACGSDVSSVYDPPPALLNLNGRNKAACHDGIELDGGEIPSTEFRCQPATRLETTFRHASWAPQREHVWRSLLRLHVNRSRLDRFRECGSGLWLRRGVASGELSLSCNACRDRLCNACGGDRAVKIVAALEVPMCETTSRFVTLTKRHNTLSLADNLDLLYEQFVRLRHRRWWRDYVRGGAAFLEVTFNAATRTWHVHFHLIIDGDFIPQRELSREWLASTGDSSIVDVRAIPDWKRRARYVTKYVTKPASPSVVNDPDALDEFITAIRGRRLCFTFGTWRGIKLNDAEAVREKTEPISSIEHLRSTARLGDETARLHLRMAAAKWPSLAALFHTWGDSS